MIRPCLELSSDQHTAVANAASKQTVIASRQLVHCTESGTPSGNGEPSLLASCHSPSTAEKRQFSLRGHAAGYFSRNKMLWPGSIKPASSVRTPATANSKQLNSSSSSRPSTCLHDAAHTMGSIPTYIVLATASLSVTYLAFLLYSAYGFAAFKAAAPFIGTVTLVFGESVINLAVRCQPEPRGYVQDKGEVRVLLVRDVYPPLLKLTRLS